MQRDRKREIRKPVKEVEEGFRQEEGHMKNLHPVCLLREGKDFGLSEKLEVK